MRKGVLVMVALILISVPVLVGMDQTQSITIRCIDPEQSQPISGATIELQNQQGQILSSVKTDSDGEAKLDLSDDPKAGSVFALISDDNQEDVVGTYFDRKLSLDATTGERTVFLVPNHDIADTEVRADYSSFLEMLRRNVGKEPAALVDSSGILGTVDTLSRSWGKQIMVCIGSEPNGTSEVVSSIIYELNQRLGFEYLRRVNYAWTADWVFDYSEVNFRQDRRLTPEVSFDEQGKPERAVFRVSGRFYYPNDLKTRLRMAFAEVLLLNKSFDPRLIDTGRYDGEYFKMTTFSLDFLNILRAVIALGDGRDYSGDLNEVNRTPVSDPGGALSAKVGEKVTLTSLRSADPEGQIVSVTWQQVFGTKEGTEYMSPNEIPLPDPHATAWAFVPEWPGNYRFRLTVTDDGGRSNSRTIDVAVQWKTIPFEMKGVNAFAYWDPSSLASFASDVLGKMVEHGVEWIEFAPYGWMKTKTSNVVERLGRFYPGCPGFTISDSELAQLVDLAHSIGLRVFLRPTLEFYNWKEWRGVLAPSDVAAWFTSYQQFIAHYAQIARDTHVEMFAVGNELFGVQGYASQWEEVVRLVRSIVPKGTLLTYCDQSLVWSYSNVRFWGCLDLIGVDFAYPITGSGDVWETNFPGSDDPRYSTYLASIEKSVQESLETAHRTYGRDVLITETGCASALGANTQPSVWQFDASAVVDTQQQQRYLEAVVQVASSRSWIRGVFAYCVEIKSDYNYQIEDWPIDHSIAGRPAYGMLSYWYSGEYSALAETITQQNAMDRDGDGVPDEEDYCPDWPGDPGTNGC